MQWPITLHGHGYHQRISLQWCHKKARVFSGLSTMTTKINQSSVSLALREGNPPVTGGFPSERATNSEKVFMPWRYNLLMLCGKPTCFHLCSYFQLTCSVLATQMEMPSPWNFQWECHRWILWKRSWQNICDYLIHLPVNIYLPNLSIFLNILRLAQDEQITPFDAVLSYSMTRPVMGYVVSIQGRFLQCSGKHSQWHYILYISRFLLTVGCGLWAFVNM